MSDVFISYSRKDAAFAKRLFDKLESTGRESWIDWEGIPLSADWWAQIRQGIDEATTFVLILSPDSLASAVCTLEVAHAITANKRIIPVVYRESPIEEAFGKIAAVRPDNVLSEMLAGRDILLLARDNWTKLGHINWIFFREADDFDVSFTKTVAAIETDLIHLARHTRYYTQARQWDDAGRTNDLLLIGDEIAAAEQWLSEGRMKKPVPSSLHETYITQSRQAEDQRQRVFRNLRRARTGLSAFVTIAVVIALIAGLFANNAVQRVNEGQMTLTVVAQDITDQQNLVESLRLTVLANNILQDGGQEVEIAALLSIRALNIAYSLQAEDALIEALNQLSLPYSRQIFAGHT